jgi:hypothetical protein
MINVDSFKEGDVVIFKIDQDDYPDVKKYCVVGKKDGKVVISYYGETKEVHPLEIMATAELDTQLDHRMQEFGDEIRKIRQ